MPLDMNDPEVKSAVEAMLSEAVKGLKDKNAELLAKLDRQKPDAEKLANYDKVMADNASLQEKLDAAKKAAKDATEKLAATTTQLTTLDTQFQRTMIDRDLSDALVKVNVDPALMPAVKALLERDAKVIVEGENRKAVIGDKPVGDFVSAWATSDAGKAFVKAPASSGAGGQGNAGNNGNGAQRLTKKPEFKDYPLGQNDPGFYRDSADWADQQKAA
jgi:seryl-tRNA synthetase